ncbi:MAG TPA: NADH-quinone oxidoreductase subunit D [Candidatus Xenobia bacterium]|jgi:NADH-quinone oxidoreductase subunit D
MATLEITPVSALPQSERPPSGDSTHVIKFNQSEVPDGTEPFLVNFGPQHPSMHGVFRLEALLDGEKVLGVRPFIHYMHRNFEKHVENKEYYQIPPYFDRLDYVAAMTQELTYVMGVEQLLDWPVPPRADFLRVIMCELNRISSHCLAWGTFGMDLGALTPIFYTFHQREKILDLFELASGARLLYNYFVVGGLTRDIPKGFVDRTKTFLDEFEKDFMPELDKFLIQNAIYWARTTEIGVITPELAERHALTGPNQRCSGVRWDLRKHYPYNPELRPTPKPSKGGETPAPEPPPASGPPAGFYSVYNQFEFDIPVGDGAGGRGPVGSCWDRMMVRFKEMKESCRIVRQALDKLPRGSVQHLPMPRALKPTGQAFVSTEAARGELGMRLIADGTERPYRVHVNSPGFNVIYALPELCRDILVADLIAVVGSCDFVMGEVGR